MDIIYYFADGRSEPGKTSVKKELQEKFPYANIAFIENSGRDSDHFIVLSESHRILL